MDISAIQDLLSTFSTFAGNIGNFLKIPVELINDLFGNDYDTSIGATEGALAGLSSTDETPAGTE